MTVAVVETLVSVVTVVTEAPKITVMTVATIINEVFVRTALIVQN